MKDINQVFLCSVVLFTQCSVLRAASINKGCDFNQAKAVNTALLREALDLQQLLAPALSPTHESPEKAELCSRWQRLNTHATYLANEVNEGALKNCPIVGMVNHLKMGLIPGANCNTMEQRPQEAAMVAGVGKIVSYSLGIRSILTGQAKGKH